MTATTGQRINAYLLDFIFSLPFCLIWLIPFIGTLLGGLLLFLYWLLRDLLAPSLGKKMVGLRVVDANGNPASTGSLVLRNLPLALPCLIVMIPFISFAGAGLDIVGTVIELIMLVSTGSRLGDRIANTTVVKV